MFEFTNATLRGGVIVVFVVLGMGTHIYATPIFEDRGIQMAGPFGIPDIHHPPTPSSEAAFLSGSVETAPLYLNEFVLAPDGTSGFANDGLVSSNPFQVIVTDGGANMLLSWNLTGTGWAVQYLSVNFNNNFYHVYAASGVVKLDAAVLTTGNGRDVISHVRLFGAFVSDTGATTSLLATSFIAIALLRWTTGHRPA